VRGLIPRSAAASRVSRYSDSGKIAVAGKWRFVGERDVLRLAPDAGTYRE
jgi:hypothetical protein